MFTNKSAACAALKSIGVLLPSKACNLKAPLDANVPACHVTACDAELVGSPTAVIDGLNECDPTVK